MEEYQYSMKIMIYKDQSTESSGGSLLCLFYSNFSAREKENRKAAIKIILLRYQSQRYN
jgi:hypothetical protein